MSPEEWSITERKASVRRRVIVGVVVVLLAGGAGYGLGARSSERAAPPTSPPASQTVTTHTTTSTTSPTSTTTTSTVAPGPAGPFAGEWYHHGFTMALEPTGHGVMEFRLYKYCSQDPPPCDVSVGHDLYDPPPCGA